MDYISFFFDTMMNYIAFFLAAALYIGTFGAMLCSVAEDLHESHKKKQYIYERKMHNENL